MRVGWGVAAEFACGRAYRSLGGPASDAPFQGPTCALELSPARWRRPGIAGFPAPGGREEKQLAEESPFILNEKNNKSWGDFPGGLNIEALVLEGELLAGLRVSRSGMHCVSCEPK